MQGFYLPGVAPRAFKDGEAVQMKVQTLVSTETPLQVSAIRDILHTAPVLLSCVQASALRCVCWRTRTPKTASCALHGCCALVLRQRVRACRIFCAHCTNGGPGTVAFCTRSVLCAHLYRMLPGGDCWLWKNDLYYIICMCVYICTCVCVCVCVCARARCVSRSVMCVCEHCLRVHTPYRESKP